MQRMVTLLTVTTVFAAAFSFSADVAFAAQRCFQETGHCIEGQFLEFWEENGGLAVFGYPISDARNEVNPDTGQTYLTQWFERNRFELHPELAPPYRVLLGRLGNDRLIQQGRDWFTFEKADPMMPHYFEQTGHAVAETFWPYWAQHGLEFDGTPGTSFEESLALFGMPLSEPAMETNAAGDTVLTQWFERARLEYHPTNPQPHKILLGLLSSEVREGRQTAPPVAERCEDGVPPSVDGSVVELCIYGGDIIEAIGHGFEPGERIGFYVTTPGQKVISFPVIFGDPYPDAGGNYRIRGALSADTPPGVYALSLDGTQSGHRAVIFFKILAPDTNAPARKDHSLLPPNEDAIAMPESSPRGTHFTFKTSGLQQNEAVRLYSVGPDGTIQEAPFDVFAGGDGNAGRGLEFVTELSDPVGVYKVVFEGRISGKRCVAHFRVE